nr:TadE family type IV pilus minor pilin [Streptomyces sp. 891-h]
MSRRPRLWGGRWRDGDPCAGYVTAEAAVVIPALVLLVAGLLWGLMAAVARIQCVDAARAGARAAARGEPEAGVSRAARSAAPHGARVEMTREGELVRVAVRVRTVGPGPLSVELRSEAVAADERRAGDGKAP